MKCRMGSLCYAMLHCEDTTTCKLIEDEVNEGYIGTHERLYPYYVDLPRLHSRMLFFPTNGIEQHFHIFYIPITNQRSPQTQESPYSP
jgi:hypothetical protein